jgi:hypothetical protein
MIGGWKIKPSNSTWTSSLLAVSTKKIVVASASL